jgi:branched-chain amino acid transport system substrate-binding protein
VLKMRKKTSCVLLFVFVMMLALTGCSSSTSPSPDTEPDADEEKVIRVGWIAPFSGNYAWAGQYLLDAAQMAADEINAQGGAASGGVRIEILHEDDGGDPTKSVNATIKLIENDKVDIIMGPFNSSCTLANMVETERREFPQITFSLSPVITEQGHKWIFRMSPADDVTMTSILDYATQVKGFTKLAFLTDTTDYGTSGYIVGEPYLKELGLEPLTNEKFNIPDKDFTAQLLKIRAAEPDAIVLHGDEADCGLIAKQRLQLGMNDIPIIGGLPLTGVKYLENGGPEGTEGTMVATSFLANSDKPVIQEFVKNFTDRYGYTPEARCAAAYDGMYVLAEALKNNGGKTDNVSLREGILNVQGLEGVQGTFNYDEYGNGLHSVMKGIFKNGEIEFLAE